MPCCISPLRRGLVLALCTSWAWGAPTPPLPHFPASTQLQYEVIGRSKGLPYRAQARLDWQNQGQRYQAQMTMSAFLVGSRIQISTGQLLPTGLQPAHFVDRARQERQVVFDRQTGQATDTSKQLTTTVSADVQDKLSILLQLGWHLSRQSTAPTTDSQWTFPVMGPHGVEAWIFDWRGKDTLQLKTGALQTWRLQRRPEASDEVGLTVWLAPELDWLPVRLVLQQENGDRVEQSLLALPPQGAH